ncbi:MAG: MATE family efflux transporter [Muribaculum sp.]|nr:MATE family efflux transporter [Muribaculaceae bacterium]MCM1081531.1 MATE family efflux transporter [Muribaculum sp.]
MRVSSGINHRILALAVPAIFSNITVPLLGLSDTFISGHLGSELYIAAIAVGTMMTNALFWLFDFLRAGTSGLAAEAFGRQDSDERRRVFTISLLLAIIIGLILIAASDPATRIMLLIMNPEAETSKLAGRYFQLVVLSSPALLATTAVTGWMIGSQNTVYPMIVAIVVNVLNITVSFTLVFWAKIGFVGVAVGTMSANWFGMFLSLYLSRRMNGGAMPMCPLKQLKLGRGLQRFFKVNADLMLRSICVLAVPYAMTAYGARMGNMTLAVNAIIMQFFLFFSYFMDGFAYSAEALCGRFLGAGDKFSLTATVKQLCRWGAVMAAVFITGYLLFTRQITELLTDNEAVVAGVVALKPIVCVIPMLSVAAFIFDGVYIGLTATRTMLLSTFIATVVYFTLAGMQPFWRLSANAMLWIAFLTFLLLRGLLLFVMVKHTISNSLSR